ncbi:MAG: hypothetical protein KAV87_39265 [Desulfobacteraceae bacterium]|nr:hypothetical protein [Desulfobacteraceae bacterium]
MTTKTYNRLSLAENQLETAIGLFVSGGDKFSVITLAGAADVILCRLVLNLGQENFTDFMIREFNEDCLSDKTRAIHGRQINDTLLINDLKHMDEGDDGFIVMDVDECALGAVLKAVANYVMIAGRDKDFIKAFFAWVQLNLDPKKYNIYYDPDWRPST